MPATDTLVVTPLTTLKEEENLFRAAVRDFAEDAIAPLAASMDEKGSLEPSLLPKLFDLGLMGIEIPEAYGGPGGSFFMSCLAIEELSRIDAAVAVVVDVHNTLVTNAVLRWGTPEQHARFLPTLAKHAIASYSLSEADAGSDAFSLRARATRQGDQFHLNGAQALDLQCARGRRVHHLCQHRPRLGSQGHHGIPGRTRFPRSEGRQERTQAWYPSHKHVRVAPRELRGARQERPGQDWRGLQGGYRNPQTKGALASELRWLACPKGPCRRR